MAVKADIAITEFFKRHRHFIAGVEYSNTFGQND
ncbi:MAG: hypothetical protein RL420_1317, partial [Pseudomonadota bacterium]